MNMLVMMLLRRIGLGRQLVGWWDD